MSAIDVVKAFYESNLVNDANMVPKYFHKDSDLHWASSQGFTLLNYKDIEAFFEGTRHTVFGTTIEHPYSEPILAHYSTLWEVRDGKLYCGFEISQQADENDKKTMKSYEEINI
ncbi:nuclear transport factor 2 family protein [Winogradskyella helgolandensis]|uniref:nuclear transport factor 2 family protein n=1 Tax=Winogradskyella helgolandensis TaxID=2697010 RepID=UPI0015CC7808|nr:nuclear transport factor 2 family protein [Winogradskyella helgolandensis]